MDLNQYLQNFLDHYNHLISSGDDCELTAEFKVIILNFQGSVKHSLLFNILIQMRAQFQVNVSLNLNENTKTKSLLALLGAASFKLR